MPVPSPAAVPKTDVTGCCFLSYRRSQVDDVSRLASQLREHGIPIWQDIENLGSEGTVEAIASALDDPSTAAGVVWLSGDIGDSPIIMQEELPRILRRARSCERFRAHLVLTGGLDFKDVSQLLKDLQSLDDPAKTWNIIKAPGGSDAEQLRALVTRRVLSQRLADLQALLPAEAPLKIRMCAHAHANAARELGSALVLDWSRRFKLRHASDSTWRELTQTMACIRAAIREKCPGRKIVVEGHMTIATALLLGRAFPEPSGIPLSWVQLTPGLPSSVWSLSASPEPSGLVAQLLSHDVTAKDLGVLVSIRGSVEPAIKATEGLPPFRALLRIGPQDSAIPVTLDTPGKAVNAAREIAEQIRRARQLYPVTERTHIFFSGPVGVAMMLGQQLNAVGPVHTYEHDQSSGAVGRYEPAAVLCD